ncbi:MAG: DUF1579 family protein [Phycisphaerales bacterium JB060]
MARIATLLAPCGRGPVLAAAIASAAALGLGLAAGARIGPASPATAVQEGNQDRGWQDMDPGAMMEMMAQMGAPGPQHKELAVFVGDWKTKMTAMGPGMEAFNSTGTATFEPIMGGRFIKQTFHGSMMGQDFTGMGLSGYNKASQRYEGVWHDDMNTALLYTTGQKTDTGWVYEGEETDPMSGETFAYRHVVTMDGKDAFSFVMQYPPEVAAQMGVRAEEGAKWADAFRIDYTRAGSDDAPEGGNRGGGNAGNGNRR